MTAQRATFVAMPVAALMIGHQVAAKAVREATFLSAWPVSALPAIVIATALLVIVVAPIFSRLLARIGPHRVVAAGFAASAIAHLFEWQTTPRQPWVAAAIYLHIGAFGSLLLSGFWSTVSELFDPQTARTSYGRIGAAGTAGGVLGGLAVTGIASDLPESSALVLLAGLHAACAIGTVWLRPVGLGHQRTSAGRDEPARWWFDPNLLARMPHLKTLGLIVVLGTASAAIADYLLKVRAVDLFGSGAGLLGFFGRFYLAVQIATVGAQLLVGTGLRRLGLGRTMSILPAGVTVTGTLALLYPVFPMFVAIRGSESVLRGSLFRSAYELIFVPMAPAEKHRTKTLLDVTCDRLGDAVGAMLVQLALFTGAAFVSAELLAVMIGMALLHLWLAGRLDALYLRVIERRLRAHPEATPIIVGSETGWTVLDLPSIKPPERKPGAERRVERVHVDEDPTLRRLADLRSGDRARVERALDQLVRPTALDIAQVVQLLAWDDVVPRARAVLERHATSFLGLLTDILIDPDTDFAIRRRVPRILADVPEPRALAGLLRGLDDGRFEVRYQCSRALRRLVARHPTLAVGRAQVLSIVERELAVPVAVWRGHRLIDQVERDEDHVPFRSGPQGSRNIEHVFSLLSLVIPAEPLAVALRGLESGDASLKGVAAEYLVEVLPPAIWTRLRTLLESGEPETPEPTHRTD